MGIFDLFSRKEEPEIVKTEEEKFHLYLAEGINNIKIAEDLLDDIIKTQPWPDERERKVGSIRNKLFLGTEKLGKSARELYKLKERARRIKEKRLSAGYQGRNKLSPAEEKKVFLIGKETELANHIHNIFEVFHNIKFTVDTKTTKYYLVSDYRRFKEDIAKTLVFLKSLKAEIEELLTLQGR